MVPPLWIPVPVLPIRGPVMLATPFSWRSGTSTLRLKNGGIPNASKALRLKHIAYKTFVCNVCDPNHAFGSNSDLVQDRKKQKHKRNMQKLEELRRDTRNTVSILVEEAVGHKASLSYRMPIPVEEGVRRKDGWYG